MMGGIIQKAEDRKLAIPYSSEFYILEFSHHCSLLVVFLLRFHPLPPL